MKLLTRHISKSFTKYFFLSFSALFGISLMVTIFENLRTFIRFKSPLADASLMIAAQTPWLATQVMPLSALLGALIAVAMMSRNGELTILRAAGIPIRRLALPLLIGGIIISGTNYFLQEQVVPASNALHRETWFVKIRGRSPEKLMRSNDVWFRSGNAFVHADIVTGDNKEILGVRIFEVEGNELQKAISAKKALWEKGGWTLHDLTLVDLTGKDGWATQELANLNYPIAPPPEDIYITRDRPDELSMSQLRRSINSQKIQGLAVNDMEVDFWAKTAIPFASILMVLLAVPFAARVSKRAGMWGAVAKGIGIGLLYYLVTMLGISLARTQALPPYVAAWLPNSIVGAIALYLLARSETSR